MKTFKVKTKYSDEQECYFLIKNGYLQIYNTVGEPVMFANVPDDHVPFPKQIAVKNYSENEGLEEALLSTGILGEKVGELQLSYNSANIYNINQDVLNEYLKK